MTPIADTVNPKRSAPPPGSHWRDVAVLFPIAVAMVSFYFWTATSSAAQQWVNRDEGDYYNLLVGGFREGHLYMKAEPDPALFLPPEQRPAGYTYLLDASLYHRHYYLYFGITPLLTVFLPFRLITGYELHPAIVCALQGSAAFLAGLALLVVLRREFAPWAGRMALAGCAFVWGLGSALPVVLRKPSMYEVATTGGMAWGIACLFCAVVAVLRPGRSVPWLAFASGCAGLAVGSRPNLAVGVAALAGLATVWIIRKHRAGRISSGAAFRMGLAAAGPAVTCAAGLMAYNFLRFGNPLEFGHRYQIGSNAAGFFSPRFAWHNLKLYYFTPPVWSGVFPFFAQGMEQPAPPGYIGSEAVHGQFFCLLWVVALGVLAAMARPGGPDRGPGRLAVGSIFLAWLAGNLALLLCVSVRADRYMLDFHPALALIGCGLLLEIPALPRGWVRRGAAALGLSGIVVIAAFNVGISFETMELFRTMNPDGYARVERVFDRFSWPFYRLTNPRFGPLVLDVVFPSVPAAPEEPLITVGFRPNADSLIVRYIDGRHAQLQLRNDGDGGPSGPPFAFKPGVAHRMTLWMGSLLPPADHPWFDGQDGASVQRQKTLVRVTLDDREIFRAGERSHDFDPANPMLGALPRFLGGPPGRFSGRLKRVDAPAPEFTEYPPDRGAVWGYRLELRLPEDRFGDTEPLITTGVQEAGDTYAMRYVDAHTIEIIHDQKGGGIVASAIVPADYSRTQTFEVLFDPVDFTPGPAHYRAVVIKDGRVVLKDKVPTRPFAFGQEVPALNPLVSSVARRYFGGTILSVGRTDQDAAERSGGQGGRPARIWRPAKRSFRLELRFPERRPGRNEPLIAAGRVGIADGLYVRYGIGKTVQFGFDHWGIGGFLSESVAATEMGVDIVDVVFGQGDWSNGGAGELRVTLNGNEVLRRRTNFFAVKPNDVAVGENRIGFSTSDPVFSGTILSVDDAFNDP